MKTPQLPLKEIEDIILANKVPRHLYPVVLLAIRGLYLDSMGVVGENDRRIYDDALFMAWPDGVGRYVANTDPNGYRKGHGTGASKGMAMLKPGIHLYGTGRHKGRLAFRQAEVFTVMRDGDPPYEDRGWHAINLHDGGNTSTSSLGCQTLAPPYWAEFRPLCYSLLDRYANQRGNTDQSNNVHTVPYILLEETERRKGNVVVSKRFF